MFRFEGFCDDLKAHKIMLAVNGLALNFKIVPVVNAVAKNGKLEAETGGDMLELFVARMNKGDMKIFDTAFIKQFLLDNGWSEQSSNHLIGRATETKLIKRIGRGKYQVNHRRS